ncbi:MAG: hypothetical protein JWN04_5300 [Myxococcaceae bacterium]|nr:hypothetical protein [Myxococcaceae bacterium]
MTETRHGVVLLNRFAQRRGHLMVWSRAHVEHLHELPWSSYAELQRLVYEANLALQQVLEPLRVYSATLGSASSLPMSYPHLHVHVIPVHESDERARPARVLSWSEGVVLYDADEASALVRELRASWPSHL